VCTATHWEWTVAESGLNCTTFCCSGLTSQPSPPGFSVGSWVARYRGKGVGRRQEKTALPSTCCRSYAPGSRWRTWSWLVGQIERAPVGIAREWTECPGWWWQSQFRDIDSHFFDAQK